MSGFPLDWHVILAALSAALSLAAGVMYVKDILRGGDTKPNAVSFFLWTVLQSIALIGQLREGASWSVVVVVFLTLNTAAVTILALSGYGYRRYGWVDLFCFVVAMGAAAMLWSNPTGSILLAIIGDFSAFIPTYVKTYREPESEHLRAWTVVTLSALLGVLATARFDLPNLAFPVYATISNGLVLAFVFIGKRASTQRT